MKRFPWTLTITMAAVLSLSALATAQPSGPPPAMVRVDEARLERVERRREVTGELRAVRRARLAAQEEGLVVRMQIDVGDQVNAGDVLAELDTALLALDVQRLEAQIQSAEAVVEERRAQIAKAERDLQRLRQLASREGASQNEVDDALTTLTAWRARLAEAQADTAADSAELKRFRQRLSDKTIRAPFAGRVVSKSIEVGEWLSEGDPVVEVVALDEVDAFLDVPERFLAALSPGGTSVDLRIEALDRTITAVVTSIVALGDRQARTFPVRIRLPNGPSDPAAGKLRAGMSVVGLIPTGEPVDGLTIHKDSVMRNDAGSFVYIDAGGKAAVAPVELLYALDERVVVRSPVLKPGMKVITEGNERVFPGQPLNVLGVPGAPRTEPAAEPQTEQPKPSGS